MDDVSKLFKIISWIDLKRWESTENYNFIHYCEKINSQSDFDEMLLTHWVCYIVDRQMPFEKIWINGGYVYSSIISDFIKNKIPIETLLKQYLKEDKKTFFYKNREFASRYGKDDIDYIKQTLKILEKYNFSFLKFLDTFLKKFKDDEKIVLKISCALFLLTYKIKKKINLDEENNNIINDDKLFEKEYNNFVKSTNSSKKRLWCSVRDYFKKGSFFNKILLKALPQHSQTIKKIQEKYMNQ
ncbi:MAG: hypothetical protein WC393_02050, partial [Candidatus Nanoarchaeia archaeon]